MNLFKDFFKKIGSKDLYDEVDKFLQKMPELKKSFPKMYELLSSVISDEESDLREKEEVYRSIAEFLSEKLELDKKIAFKIVQRLCGEQLDEEPSEEEAELLDLIGKFLIMIKLKYSLKDNSTWLRVLEIYYLKQGHPSQYKVSQEIFRDYLPEEIRRDSILNNQKFFSYTLYPLDR